MVKSIGFFFFLIDRLVEEIVCNFLVLKFLFIQSVYNKMSEVEYNSFFCIEKGPYFLVGCVI